MSRLTFLAVLTFLSLGAAPELNPVQKAKNLESFDLICKTVEEQYWDPKLGGVDWTSAKAELRPKVENAKSMQEARLAMQELLNRLGVSHLGILPSDAYTDVQGEGGAPGQGNTGMIVEPIDGRAVVRSVDKDGPAAKAGIAPGWVLLTVAGKDIEPALQRVAGTKPANPGLVLRSVINRRLHGDTGQSLPLEMLDGKDQPRTVSLTLGPPKGKISQFGLLPPIPVWFEFSGIQSDIGYVRFNIFLDAGSMMPKFGEAVKACEKCGGFIIDLRGNPGGIGFMATGMAGWFVEKSNLQLGTMITRETKLNFVINPRPPLFGGKLAILIDEASASTSEIMAGGLKDLGRARIFGTRSAGAALPSVIILLPNGDGFQYAAANYISQGGKPLEGSGVTPDEPVKLTRAALLTGHDPVIDAAVRWIEGQ